MATPKNVALDVGKVGGILAAFALALWPHLSPQSVMDQGVVDASVKVAMREVVDSAKVDIDAQVTREVEHLKDSICDKVDGLRAAVTALKDLTIAKMTSSQREIDSLRGVIQELKLALQHSRASTKEVTAKLQAVEKQLTELEHMLDTMGFDYEESYGGGSLTADLEDELDP